MTMTEMYAVVAVLATAVVTLAGLWVRSMDEHKRWATQAILDHARTLAVLQNDYQRIFSEISDIKRMIESHTRLDRKYQAALVKRFNLEVDEDEGE